VLRRTPHDIVEKLLALDMIYYNPTFCYGLALGSTIAAVLASLEYHSLGLIHILHVRIVDHEHKG
jgi:hypothetical protein